MEKTHTNNGAIRVGSWPGPEYDHNPFIKLFCSGLSEAGIEVVNVPDPRHICASQIDILHIHWPEKVFWYGGSLHRIAARTAATAVALKRLKQAGVRVVWTVHNLHPHDLQFKFRLLWAPYHAHVCNITDGIVSLSPATLPIIRSEIKALRDKPGISAWHPAYPHHQPEMPSAQLRKSLGIASDAFVFAFVGLVRPYKGIEELVRAFQKISGNNFALLIAGSPLQADYAAEIATAAAADPRIKLVFRHLSDEEFAAFTAAADVLVFPFRDYLHSGSLVHALTQHKTSLTPRTPFAESLRDLAGVPWVQTYTQPLTPEILLSARPAQGAPSIDALQPLQSGEQLAAFYRSILSSR